MQVRGPLAVAVRSAIFLAGGSLAAFPTLSPAPASRSGTRALLCTKSPSLLAGGHQQNQSKLELLITGVEPVSREPTHKRSHGGGCWQSLRIDL